MSHHRPTSVGNLSRTHEGSKESGWSDGGDGRTWATCCHDVSDDIWGLMMGVRTVLTLQELNLYVVGKPERSVTVM